MARTSTSNIYNILEKIQEEIPGFSVKFRKDSKLIYFIFKVLSKITKRSYDSFITTIGRTVYVPEDFWTWEEASQYTILSHEFMYLKQFRNWPFKILGKNRIWVINACIMSFCYLFVSPVFFTFRAKFEREGYKQTLLCLWKRGNLQTEEAQNDTALWIADLFGSSTYFYMWTRKKAYTWARECMLEFARSTK